jgi:hypothetical protein
MATPVANPAVLSNGTVNLDGDRFRRGAVPSETVPFKLACRKMAKPFNGSELSIAHCTVPSERWAVSDNGVKVALPLK